MAAGSGDFAHLHVHTEYSMLDGASLLDGLFARVNELGMSSIAMTDHGNLHGAYDFWAKARQHGVKPIIGCLVQGQEIITADGVKAVEDVEVGDRVLTHRGRFREVTTTMRRPYRGRAYTVRLAGRYGRTLTLTEEHPVLVRGRDGLVDWKKPGDITPGRPGVKQGREQWNSWVCLPKLQDEQQQIDLLGLLPSDFSAGLSGGVQRTYESKGRAPHSWDMVPPTIELTPALAYLLGLYAAEGSLAKRSGTLTGTVMFSLHASEGHLADRIERAMAGFGAATRRYRPDGRPNSLEVHVSSVPVAYLLAHLVGTGASSKRVPEEVLNGSAAVRTAFLEGVLDGDGKNPAKPKNLTGRRDFKTASRNLAWGVRTLLADRGFWATVSEGTAVGTFPEHRGDREYRWYMLSYAPNRTFKYTLEDDEYCYRPVADVIPIELDTEVYNFEVDEDNSYVSDFVLHNCEMYLTPQTHRSERRRVRWGRGGVAEEGGDDVAGGGAYTHMTMWAESTEGMHNLFRLSSRSSLEGQYYKPRADRELLHEHARGMIATTGCPSGEIQTRLRLGQYDEARKSAAEFQEIFGKDSFFLELMDHGIDVERRVRDDLLRLGKELGLPPVATNDSHYNLPEDRDAHDALICVASGKRISDTNRLRFDGNGYYIKSATEMRELWADRNGMPEACDNTLLIAERCDVEFEESTGGHMAQADIPAGETEESWFVKEVWRGIESRYPGDRLSDDVRARVEMELEVIKTKGYCGYYLVVADFIQWAKANGIRVGPGRGSGAGSIAAYALRVTDLCPLEHGLIFERFLNPERPSMPDFDIDFDERRRTEVIQYVSQKYGSDRVAYIATFGRLKAKAALKDAARVLDYGFAMGERITKALPDDVMGKGVPLTELFNAEHKRYHEAKEFRELHDQEPDVRKIYDTAVGLEGQIRNWGVHAAGVIMSSRPLIDIVPIMRREQDGAIITQFDYPMCEALGLVKMDFLGLRNLTVLDDALENITMNRGEEVVLEELPFDDPATYQLLSAGDTLGVFQLDGGPMRALLRSMRPDKFADISAVGALYRPGPMGADSHNKYARRKNGREPIDPIHPDLADALEPVLGETYGLIVYQEQVMEIAQVLAGFTLGQADNLRRAMGKKKKEELDKQYAGFQSGMLERGYSQSAVTALWEILLPFSDYAFNKAHSAAYGVISYWTAYLKANYAPEYMAALLTSMKGDKDKMAVYLNECRRMKIQVLPPDVNESAHNFTPVGNDIRFGLTAVRNVGSNVVDGVVAAREEQGRFTDFNDFLAKVPLPVCNKRVIESLINAGAFDDMKHRRRALVAVHETAVDQYVDIKRNEAIGQDSLFADLDDDAEGGGYGAFGGTVQIPDIDEWDKMTLLGHEREMLGLYVSDHPLLGLEHVLAQGTDCTIGSLVTDEDRQEGITVTVSGLVTGVQRKMTKNGEPWAIVTLEDLEGAIDVLLFPRSYQLASTVLTEDAILTVKGRLSRSKDQPELHANEVTVPDLSVGSSGPVVISLPATRCTGPVVNQLKDVLRTHPGMCEVRLRLMTRHDTKVMRLDDRLRVDAGPALYADLKQLLGPGCLNV